MTTLLRQLMTGISSTDTTSHPRGIRSFVLREGRMTEAQKRALAEHWPRFGINHAGAPRDFDALFGRHAPLVMEIGFGNGEALAWSSAQDPQRDFIGVEVHGPGVGRLLNALAERDVRNVRVYRHDAVQVLEHDIPPAALSEVRIWFPDPWPKKRHHKRRLIQPDFVALLASRMTTGGLLHLATDWQPYAAHMLEVLEVAPEWRNAVPAGGYADRPPWRMETRFERRGLKLGHDVADLLYRRC